MPPPLAGKIVAELNFGFWTSMLSARYDPLWAPNRHRLFYTVFPHATGIGRKTIAARFTAIKDLRNRVAHYEAVWYKAHLVRQHMEIHEAIEWINPTVGRAILSVDSFQSVYNGKAQVEADLKRYLGIP